MKARLFSALFIMAFCGGVSLGTTALLPRITPAAEMLAPDLAALLPEQFGDWRARPLAAVIRPAEDIAGQGTATLYRTYQDSTGRVVTMVVVYGSARGDAVRLHQPEICYRAQGYAVSNLVRGQLAGAAYHLPVTTMIAEQSLRRDAITYWVRKGDRVVRNEAGQQLQNILAGFGRSTDSVLVRVSSRTLAPAQSFDLHQEFIKALLAELPPATAQLLVGQAGYMAGQTTS